MEYLPTLGLFEITLGVNVGKYSSTMDPLGIFDLRWILPCPPATCQQILREGSRQQGIEFARGGAEDGANVRDVVVIRQFPLLLVLSNRG